MPMFTAKCKKKYLCVHWQNMAQQTRKIAQTCLRRSAFLQLCASCGWPLIYIELVFCWISMSFELLLQQPQKNYIGIENCQCQWHCLSVSVLAAIDCFENETCNHLHSSLHFYTCIQPKNTLQYSKVGELMNNV